MNDPDSFPCEGHIHEHDTQPSHPAPVNPKIYPLLIEEEEARRELTANIDTLLGTASLRASSMNGQEIDNFMHTVEHTLFTFKDYMQGVKELTDIVKLG